MEEVRHAHDPCQSDVLQDDGACRDNDHVKGFLAKADVSKASNEAMPGMTCICN